MKFYFAPLEGITGYIYRNAYTHFFQPPDKYFAPFIGANQYGRLSSRELNDILPEHNEGIELVPQILTNIADDFVLSANQLKTFGYHEVNLNLGCPSGTVVSKNKGSGFLSVPTALDEFLENVFSRTQSKISIKTRLGKEQPEEFYQLIEIFNKYPLEELIVHPRVQKDYYKNTPNLKVFEDAVRLSKNPIGYNGDIFTANDYRHLREACPQVEQVMLGRGLIANPGLLENIKEDKPLDKERLRAFHNQVYIGYQEIMSGERNVLFKMKETWFYMSYIFTNADKYVKKIRKAQHFHDYEIAVHNLFEEQELIQGAGLFSVKKQ